MTTPFTTDMYGVDAYLAGELPLADARRAEMWIDASVERRTFVSVLQEHAAGVAVEREPETERWLAQIQQTMQAPPRLGQEKRRAGHTRWRLPLAAAFAVMIAGMSWYVVKEYSNVGTSPVVQNGNMYTTPPGQRARVVLSDGSSVTLGPNSTLRLAATFGHVSREVTLQGEAVFTVGQIAGVPFVVRSGQTITRVLGTTFAVRAYEADSNVRVVVAEGQVSVNEGSVMHAGDVAHAQGGSTPVIQRGADIGPFFSWTAGQLSYRNVPLGQVVADLERWYSTKILIRDPELWNERITISLDNASEREMQNVLAVALDARVVRDGSHIVIARR